IETSYDLISSNNNESSSNSNESSSDNKESSSNNNESPIDSAGTNVEADTSVEIEYASSVTTSADSGYIEVITISSVVAHKDEADD
ncbi:hypothetical protein FRC02_004749, partial [Tulasnella sp. 418]